jgi:hypothetical protein
MEKQDPILNLLLDEKAIKVMSKLISSLENVRYDEKRRGFFRTDWALSAFYSAGMRLNDKIMADFDIDEWIGQIIQEDKREYGDKFKFTPDKTDADVDTNWISPLLEMEVKVPGFIIILHNIICLEDQVHSNLASISKTQREYDFLCLGNRNKTLSKCLEGGESSRKKEIHWR